ncbi:MAG: MAPEG family protein [Neisseria sp.]|nr:MAPEG family protein [Neisseria sp.]
MTLAYWCVFAVIFMPLGCAAYAKKAAGFDFARDNGNPRGFLAKAEGVAARANAAQQNCFEAFAPFAAGVVIAQVSGNAAQLTVNVLAVLFVLCRLAFVYFYLADKPQLRSLSWVGGFLATLGLFVAAV